MKLQTKNYFFYVRLIRLCDNVSCCCCRYEREKQIVPSANAVHIQRGVGNDQSDYVVRDLYSTDSSCLCFFFNILFLFHPVPSCRMHLRPLCRPGPGSLQILYCNIIPSLKDIDQSRRVSCGRIPPAPVPCCGPGPCPRTRD